MTPYAAIDFGTSNSAICIGFDNYLQLVPLEHGKESMPTAIFFNAEDGTTAYGRHAIQLYQDATEGRLMRSLKSLLGSDLLQETTLVKGKPIAYREIIATYLKHLKDIAESHLGDVLTRAVIGRPVRFVDEDVQRDYLGQSTLSEIAQSIGYSEVVFQYEPIAAALDYESTLDNEELALVVDIGGGTSDFSLIRIGPRLSRKKDRSHDVLASSGIHIAGTDFDRRLSLATVMPKLGLGKEGQDGKPIPSYIYFELSTWHKINFLYTRKGISETEGLRLFFGETKYHDRLMKVLRKREGHRIAGLVEEAKIAVAEDGVHKIPLDFIESDLTAKTDGNLLMSVIEEDIDRIVTVATQAVLQAGLQPDAVSSLYFTGGSTGIRFLRNKLAEAFPRARLVEGDKYSSVARGLGLFAQKAFS